MASKNKVENIVEPTPYIPDHVTIQLSKKDWESLIQILSISRDVFAKVVLNAVESKDENSMAIFSARSKLAGEFAHVISDYLATGEPVSRDKH